MEKKGSQQPITFVSSVNGYYDEKGTWRRNKYCFVYCGPDRCNCGPPNGIYQLEQKEEIRPQLLEDINDYYKEEE